MILPRTTSCQMFTIWSPRWHDRKVLLAAHKVGTHNSIKFTKAPTFPGEYYVSGRDIHQCPLEDNGKIKCYAVPMHFLEPLEREGVHTEEPIPKSQKQLKLVQIKEDRNAPNYGRW